MHQEELSVGVPAVGPAFGIDLPEGLPQFRQVGKPVGPGVGVGQLIEGHFPHVVNVDLSQPGDGVNGAALDAAVAPIPKGGRLFPTADGIEEHFLHQEHCQ